MEFGLCFVTLISYVDYSSLRGQNIPSVIPILRTIALLSLAEIPRDFCIEILLRTFPESWQG